MRSPARRGLLPRAAINLEAVVALTRASITLRMSQESQIPRLLGQPAAPAQDPPARPELEANLVGWAVIRAARLLPWHPTCLPQALAAKAMLVRRGISFESHLGVIQTAPFKAHAWVTVAGTPIVGGPTHHATRVATFH